MKNKIEKLNIENNLFSSLLFSIAVGALLTIMMFPLIGIIKNSNLVMVFLLSTFFIALYVGKKTALFSAIFNVALYDFFFIAPRFSFSVENSQYLITFIVMLTVGLITGQQVGRLKTKNAEIRAREKLSKILLEFSHLLLVSKSEAESLELAKSFISKNLAVELEISLTDDLKEFENRKDAESIKWALETGSHIFTVKGRNVNGSKIYIPIRTEHKTYGMLIAMDSDKTIRSYGCHEALRTTANLIALSISQHRPVKI